MILPDRLTMKRVHYATDVKAWREKKMVKLKNVCKLRLQDLTRKLMQLLLDRRLVMCICFLKVGEN